MFLTTPDTKKGKPTAKQQQWLASMSLVITVVQYVGDNCLYWSRCPEIDHPAICTIFTAFYHTLPYSTILYRTQPSLPSLPYATTLYHVSAIRYNTLSYSTILYHTLPSLPSLPYATILYHTLPSLPYATIHYHTLPYSAIHYHTLPYSAIHYHTLPSLSYSTMSINLTEAEDTSNMQNCTSFAWHHDKCISGALRTG